MRWPTWLFVAPLLLAAATATADIGPVIPPTWALYQDSPDPFIPPQATPVDRDVPTPARIVLEVFDPGMTGVVRHLVDGMLAAGVHRVTWDGTNDGANPLGPGHYPYRMLALGNADDTLFSAIRVATLENDVIGVGPEAGPGVRLLPASPNPFRGRTSIGFSVPGIARVTLEILDVAGRRQRTLLRDQEVTGGRTVEWDGRTNQGREVPDGIYLCRLRAGTTVLTRKLLRLRD